MPAAVSPDPLASLEALGPSLWRAGPATSSQVEQLELGLGRRLPPDYKDFLLRFGAVSFRDSIVSGVLPSGPLAMEGSSLYGDTQLYRRDWHLPPQYLVLQPDPEAPYCLNVESSEPDGNMAVVCFELSSRHASVVAPSFNAWLFTFFLAGKSVA